MVAPVPPTRRISRWGRPERVLIPLRQNEGEEESQVYCIEADMQWDRHMQADAECNHAPTSLPSHKTYKHTNHSLIASNCSLCADILILATAYVNFCAACLAAQ